MTTTDWLNLIAGIIVVLLVLWDLFQSVVLPRPAVGRLRLSPYVLRFLWKLWRGFGTRITQPSRREGALSVFGPANVIIALGLWVSALILGYGLILFGLRTQIAPVARDYGQAAYLSAASLLTIGFGDIVPTGRVARVVVTLEGASGLGIVALVISLLFSLFSSFQRREVQVITLDATAGAPPSGVQILETCAKFDMPGHLVDIFTAWKLWAAEVLESHLAYPVLNYFRSSHDNEAWLNSFGAVMDAAVLVVSVVDGGPTGQARLFLKIGGHLVEDLAWYFRFPHDHETGVERHEFDEACRRLRAVGYLTRDADAAWEQFTRLRSIYASPLNQMALHLAIPPAQWIGDRSYLPHRDAQHTRA